MAAAALVLALLAATEPTPPPPHLAVLVRLDTQSFDRHVRTAEMIRDIRTLWAPYADIDFADLAAPVERTYDGTVRLVLGEPAASRAAAPEPLGWITFAAPGQPNEVITVSITAARNLMRDGFWENQRIANLTKWHQQS